MGSNKELQKRSPEHLFQELLAVAHTNKRFKRRESGSFVLTTEEDERIHITDTFNLDRDERWPTPIITEVYNFTARQYPRVLGRVTRNMVDISYSYCTVLDNTTMSLNIAQEAYGLDGIEAIENAGPSTIRHAVDINIDNRDMNLIVDESVTFIDDEGDIICRTCTCKIPESHEDSFQSVLFKREFAVSEADDEYDGESDTQPQPITLVANTQFNSQAPRKFEAIDEIDEKDAYALMDLREQMDTQKADDELLLAYNILRSMKRTFARQTGMKFPL